MLDRDCTLGAAEATGASAAGDSRARCTSINCTRPRGPVPVILSGGLTAENVGDAIDVVRPFAVDVASGVESAPGRKDQAKLEAFAAAVRSAAEVREAAVEAGT